MELPYIDLKARIDWKKGLSPNQEDDLYTIFNSAINDSIPTSLSAESAAGELARLYQRTVEEDATVTQKGHGRDVEKFLWALFTNLIAVAREIASTDLRQKFLVDLLWRLKRKEAKAVTLWDEECKMWESLPMFKPCLREAWNRTPVFDDTDQDKQTIKHWISLNSFAANIVSSGVVDISTYALWGLRSALEEEWPPLASKRDTQVAVACEWITIAGRKIYDLCEKRGELKEDDIRKLRPGKLYSNGESGFSKERWTFWRIMLAERGAEGDAELKERSERVVQMMKEMEG